MRKSFIRMSIKSGVCPGYREISMQAPNSREIRDLNVGHPLSQ